MAHHVIYIPGLGDSRTYNQDKALRLWKLFGLQVHYFALGWSDQEAFSPKLDRLLRKIDEFIEQDNKVSLVGVSAGASAVLNAYALRNNLTSVVCIVGKIQNPQTVGGRIYTKNPAFKDSVYKVSVSLDKLGRNERGRILSIYPLKDMTVPTKDTFIEGAKMKRIFAFGHISAIFISLLFYGPMISRFIKAAESTRR